MNVVFANPYSVVSTRSRRPTGSDATPRQPPRGQEGVALVVAGRRALLDRPAQRDHRPAGDPEGADQPAPARCRPGATAKVIHARRVVEHARHRNATVTSSSATPMPIRFATTTNSTSG